MSVIIADIQRINDTASNVSGLLINKQLGVSNDSPRRIIYKDASGQFINITCDEDSSVNLDDVDHIQFNLAPSAIPNAEGLLRWNSTDGTLDLGMDGGDITQQIGQELFIKVRNISGSTILNGSPVYASGRTGNRPNIWLARSDNDNTSQIIGVTTQDITSPDDGYVTSLGYVRGIKTDYTGIGNWGNTWNAGDKLYVSKTISGQLTNIAPTAPHHSDIVGTVEIVHSNLGSIYINIQKHATLEELTDINGTPLTTSGQFPVWNQASGYFDFNENISNYVPRQVLIDTKEPTGFKDRTSSNLYFYNDNYTFAISGVHDIYINGVKISKPSASIQIPDTTNLYHIYYDANGTLTQSTTFPGFYLPYIASVYWNTTINSGMLGDERHGITMDADTHKWAHSNVGTRYTSGLTGTFSGTGFLITSGNLADEDIVLSIPEQTTCNILYKNGSSSWEWIPNSTNYINFSGSNIRYNNGNVLTNVPTNHYVAYWIFGTNNINKPIISMIGQRTDITLADARNNNTYESLSFGQLPFQEMKILYRVLLRNDASPYIETLDLRSVSNLPAGTYVATSHSVLTGLEWSQAGHNDTNFNVNINGSGNVGIGTNSPTSALTLGNERSIDFKSTNILHNLTGVLPSGVHGRITNIGYNSGEMFSEFAGGLNLIGIAGDLTESYIGVGVQIESYSNGFEAMRFKGFNNTLTGIAYLDSGTAIATFCNSWDPKFYIYGDGNCTLGNTLKLTPYHETTRWNSNIRAGDESFGYPGTVLNISTPNMYYDGEEEWSSPHIYIQCGSNTYARTTGVVFINDDGGTVQCGNLSARGLSSALNFTVAGDSSFDGDVYVNGYNKKLYVGSSTNIEMYPPTTSQEVNQFLVLYSGIVKYITPFSINSNGHIGMGISGANNSAKLNILISGNDTIDALKVYKNVTDPCVSDPAEILKIYCANNDYGGNVINCTVYETEDFSPLTIRSDVQGTIPPGNALIDLIGTYNSGEILNNSPLFRVSNQYYNRFIVSAQGNVSMFNDSSIDGNMTISDGHYTYYGDSSVDDSWRVGISGTSFVHQRRISGVWVNKHVISG